MEDLLANAFNTGDLKVIVVAASTTGTWTATGYAP